MKKAIALSVVFAFAFASMSFAAWKSWEDFNVYKEARKAAMEAEGAGDTVTAVTNYKKAAELAGKSATKDIQAWQTNNAAFVLIKQFKALVAYDEKLAKLQEMKPSKEKIAFQKEMSDMFSMKMDLLAEAKELLEGGKAIDGGVEPSAKIQSNLDFIAWVDEFVKTGGNPAPAATAVPAEVKAEEAAPAEVKAEAAKPAEPVKK